MKFLLPLLLLCGCCHPVASTVILWDHEYFQIDARGVWTFFSVTNADGTVDGWIRLNGPVPDKVKMFSAEAKRVLQGK